MKLDRDKNFGTVHGGVICFEQDGLFFDVQENQVDIDGKPINELKKRKAVDNETIDATI
jgi:hypothetical protein